MPDRGKQKAQRSPAESGGKRAQQDEHARARAVPEGGAGSCGAGGAGTRRRAAAAEQRSSRQRQLAKAGAASLPSLLVLL
jgi:hypothetical protein